jgi:hypothetical protein
MKQILLNLNDEYVGNLLYLKNQENIQKLERELHCSASYSNEIKRFIFFIPFVKHELKGSVEV